MTIPTPKSINDIYYFDEICLNEACKDVKKDNKEQCPDAKVLFFSFLIKVTFQKEYVFCPTEILKKINDGEFKDIYEKKVLLNQSLTEDNKAFSISKRDLNPFIALLTCTNYKSTDCVGKIKIITNNVNIKYYKKIISHIKLPIEVISSEEGAKELKEIHDFLKDNFEKNILHNKK